ncbi:Sorting nexin [Podosphaera aphanis]|nr:Sorting nexin [Podosphaera aphanis]
MSLFGKSPEESNSAVGSKPRNSLFDDDRISPGPSSISKSSSVSEDNAASTSSPWGITSLLKETGQTEDIEALLPETAIPEKYNQIFNSIPDRGRSYNGNINKAGVYMIFSHAKLDKEDEESIQDLIFQGASPSELSRDKFNVLLALIGLAQNYSEISLEEVREMTLALPIPDILDFSRPSSQLSKFGETTVKSSLHSSNTLSKKSHSDLHDSDPWANSAEQQNRIHQIPETKSIEREIINGFHASTGPFNNLTYDTITRSEGDQGTPTSNVDRPKIGDDSSNAHGGGERSVHKDSNTYLGLRPESIPKPEETVTVAALPEKEGYFMFQHRNYQVSSSYRKSKVVRRYSDFVWLLDCLQKRFPFRQLPLLPPKRVGLNGNHLAVDRLFIEKRRRGLARFMNTLLRHPVLRQDHLVNMFLTIPTELSLWRKQSSFSVEDEFSGKILPQGLEDVLPPSLNTMFERARVGISKSADICVNLCILMDRLAKRNEGLAADQLRISLSLQLVSDVTLDTYSANPKDVHLLNKSLLTSASHLNNSQSLLIDEAKAWDEGVIEDLKTQRDSLVSMRQLFERRDQLGKDNIPYLERRIKKNSDKLEEIKSKPEGMIKPEEIRKLNEAIIKDRESIVSQHARGVFIRECMRDELIHFQQTQYYMKRWVQDWAQERVKYSELQADNWKKLTEELEGTFSN